MSRPRPDALSLNFYASGETDDVLLPDWGKASADPLWAHTCFEAFVRATGEPGYVELNFAPSTRWTAWRFDSHRAGMRPAEGVDAADIEATSSANHFELGATIDGLPADKDWQVALAAVVEDLRGEKTYWALAHPPGKPDFHHPDCFALDLAVTAQS